MGESTRSNRYYWRALAQLVFITLSSQEVKLRTGSIVEQLIRNSAAGLTMWVPPLRNQSIIIYVRCTGKVIPVSVCNTPSRRVATFSFQPLDMRLGGPQRRSGCYVMKEISLPLSRIELRFPGRRLRSLGTVPYTTLCKMSKFTCNICCVVTAQYNSTKTWR
jgi:hypothetical protein